MQTILDYRIAANLLEAEGDAIVELSTALYNATLSQKDLKKIYEVTKNFGIMQEKAIDAFINNNRKLAIEAISLHKKNQSKISSLRASLENKSNIPIDFLDIVFMFDRVERNVADIADLIKPIYGK